MGVFKGQSKNAILSSVFMGIAKMPLGRRGRNEQRFPLTATRSFHSDDDMVRRDVESRLVDALRSVRRVAIVGGEGRER